MTVSYTSEVATCQGFSCFLKLLVRWRGSIYKLVWRDLVAFIFLYYAINFTYRFILDASSKELFESVVKYCRESSSFIPLSFVLGFYVSIVMKRWWDQYLYIPRPDAIAVIISATIDGQDERARVIRRTIMRYICLSATMIFTNIAPKVMKRFPTLDHLVKAGLLEENEANIIEGLDDKFPAHPKFWLPLVWAASVVARARKEGRIGDDHAVQTILHEINHFRNNCTHLLYHDRISIPLVYTQVVTLAVYTYFLTVIMGHQWVNGHEYKFDLYFPIFTLLQFFFFMGWLKVAESLINPFGDDDDDFEVNWMVDRNLTVSYLIVDEMHHEHPELMKDQYWDEVFPEELPYTEETEAFRERHPLTSTMNLARSMFKIDNMQGSRVLSAKSSYGSQQSVASTVNSFLRKNSLASSLRKVWSRQNSRPVSTTDEESQEFGQLKQTVKNKIIEQIIEEVDEQMTVKSKRDSPRPSLAEIFGSRNNSRPATPEPHKGPFFPLDHRPATPVNDQPQSPHRSENDDVSSEEDTAADSFALLKEKRDEERRSRIKKNLSKITGNKQEVGN